MKNPEWPAPSAPISLRHMRHLDRWIGLPLCVLATGILWLSRLFRRKSATPLAHGRVLYVALAEMGSIVLAAPAIRKCTRQHGMSPAFVTLEQTRAVFDFLGGEFAREVYVLRTGSLAALCSDVWSLAKHMRRSDISIVIDLDPGARFSTLIALLSGAPRRAGFAGAKQPYRGNLYTHTVDCPAGKHMSENFASLIQAPMAWVGNNAATIVDLRPVRFAATSMAMSGRILERLHQCIPHSNLQRQRIVLIHANCSDPVPQRRWPQQHYIDLCQRLLSTWPDLLLLFIGATAEEQPTTALCAKIGDPRCASIAGIFAITELPALFELSTLLVSSDSGPAHFAAHAGLPVVALFGPETPQRYSPLGATVTIYAELPCSPCLSPSNQRASHCRNAICMQEISVETVFAAMCATLAPAEKAATA